MRIHLFIDYDNLLPQQKTNGIRGIVQSIFDASHFEQNFTGNCEVRIYGGWYEGNNLSKKSQDLSASIHSDFPCLIKTVAKNGGICRITVNTSLALSMLEDPSHHLFNTYRKRGKPRNIRVANNTETGCHINSCPLETLRKSLSSGKCTHHNCESNYSELIYRAEQKIVDTMLSCDMIYCLQYSPDLIYLLSEDDDFLPPIRTALLRGSDIVRVNPKASNNREAVIVAGKTLKELEL